MTSREPTPGGGTADRWPWSALLLPAVALAVAFFDWPAAALVVDGKLGLGVYAVVSLAFSMDGIDLVFRVYLRHVHTSAGRTGRFAPASIPVEVGDFTPYQMRLHLRPYAILVSVHNLGARELETFVEGMEPFLDRLWVIDDASTDDTCERLQRAGVRCIRSETNRRKPGAIKVLLGELPREIATVLVLDPDTRILPTKEDHILDVERVVFEFQRMRMAALCPRILVRERNWLTRMQSLEYGIALSLGRKSLGARCVTSGAAVYRRDALENVLASHTLSVYAEDLKNSLILLARGEGIYYDARLTLETEGKDTWAGWFSQRVGWFFGLAKVYQEHYREVLRAARPQLVYVYQYIVYMGLFALLLHPVRVAGVAVLVLSALNLLDGLLRLGVVPDGTLTNPVLVVLGFLKFCAITGAAIVLTTRGAARRRALLALPGYFVYSLVHVLPITVGYLNWLALRLTGRRVYRDHYQDDNSLRDQFAAARRP